MIEILSVLIQVNVVTSCVTSKVISAKNRIPFSKEYPNCNPPCNKYLLVSNPKEAINDDFENYSVQPRSYTDFAVNIHIATIYAVVRV